MPERWERELAELRHIEMREPAIRDRIERGAIRPSLPTRRNRVASGIVAAIVFLAAGAFAWRALGPAAEVGQSVAPGSWPVATVSFSVSGDGDRVGTLGLGGSSQSGLIGASTSVDEPYPYAWVNPSMPAIEQPLEIPMGSELRLEGDVSIKELLYGDAEQLDAGAGLDSGVIWSDQPDFSEDYFLPWGDEPERTYLKLFGTWADGAVLDVYFEVQFVEPTWDVSDADADIVVSPEPMGAALIYGGQRMPAALDGGQYGQTSVTTELTGWDDDSIFAKVAAGSSITVSGDQLVKVSAHFGPLPFGAKAGPTVESFPEDPGRSILRLDVTWDDGAAAFLLPIEIVPAPEEPVTGSEPSPPPSSAGSVVVDIRRSSEETGGPQAIARFGTQEQWMCPDGFSLVNPDGTTDEIMFDCGQSDVFQAPVGTPIEVTGDFATLSVSAGVTGNRHPGTGETVPPLEPGSILTLGYEVTWDDGSEASFWLLLTVQDTVSTTEEPGIVVRIYGVGERSTEIPTITMTYGGETKRGCTEAFDWTLPDRTRIDEAAGGDGGLPICSPDQLFRVPAGIPITVEVLTGTEVFVTRTTTPFYGGRDGFGASVRWPSGKGDFTVAFEVVGEPASRQIVLDCPTEDRVPFTTPDGPRILPGGSAYIRGNMPGFLQTDVVEQMTRSKAGSSEWDGVWQVVRDGSVIAAVEFGTLGGVACRGSGIGGV